MICNIWYIGCWNVEMVVWDDVRRGRAGPEQPAQANSRRMDDVIAILNKYANKWCFQLKAGELTGNLHYQGRCPEQPAQANTITMNMNANNNKFSTYIYIYIYRERERERDLNSTSNKQQPAHIYIYIYTYYMCIYIYIYIIQCTGRIYSVQAPPTSSPWRSQGSSPSRRACYITYYITY